jgi:hypothetical protein
MFEILNAVGAVKALMNAKSFEESESLLVVQKIAKNLDREIDDYQEAREKVETAEKFQVDAPVEEGEDAPDITPKILVTPDADPELHKEFREKISGLLEAETEVRLPILNPGELIRAGLSPQETGHLVTLGVVEDLEDDGT